MGISKRGGGRRLVAIAVAVELSLGVILAPARAADVNITANTTTGVNLNSLSGSSVDIATGVAVSNGAGAIAINGTAAWALTNNGTVTGTLATAIKVDGTGSSVTNFSSVTSSSTGIQLVGGGMVDNKLGATISSGLSAISIGTNTAGAGTVTNGGTIIQTGTGSDLVALRFGGSVTNLAGATISANNSSSAVSLSNGASREVHNYGTITNTGSNFAAGVLVQGGASTVTNYATGTIRGTLNGIYASSSAFLTLTNAGTIESTGLDRSVRDPAWAVGATGGGTIINSGTIKSAHSDGLYLGAGGTVTNSGAITGAVNAINFSGAGTRTLKLDTGSVLNGLVKGGTGTDNLILLGSGSESLARFSSFETFSMQGSAWDINNAGVFINSAEVQSGVLNVLGTLTSPTIDIRTLGTVKGTGTLAGAVKNAGAVDLTGGTLHVTGTYGNEAAGTVKVGVTPAAAAGLLAVSGVATLSGGTVSVAAAPGSYAVGAGYRILTASSVVGTFGGPVDDSAFLQFVLDYGTAGEVWLRVSAIANIPAIAETPNQLATATVLQDMPGSPLFDAVVPLNAADALEAFDDLSGEIHASALRALLDASLHPREAALDRVDAAFAAIAASQVGARHIWARGYGAAGTVAGDGNAAALDFGSGGLLLGADGLVSREVFLGMLAGIGGTAIDIPERDLRAEATSYQVGLYGGVALGQVRVAFGAAVGATEVTVTRTPRFTGFDETLTSSYATTTAQAFGELGYAFELGDTELTPFVRAAVIGQSGGRYRESGGDAALRGVSSEIGAAVLTLGLKAARDVVVGDGLVVRATGMIGVQRTIGDRPTATHGFDEGAPFTVSGAGIGDTALLLEAGLGTELAPGVTLDLGYQGQFGSAGMAQAVRFTVSGKF